MQLALGVLKKASLQLFGFPPFVKANVIVNYKPIYAFSGLHIFLLTHPDGQLYLFITMM